jgi:hypothetical protein
VLGPREPQILPEHFEERLVDGHGDLEGLAVDPETQ